jgi:phospholipase/carboxylesterase
MGQSAAHFAREAVPLAPARASVLLPQGPFAFEVRRESGPPRQGNGWYVWTGDSDDFRRTLERVEAWLLGVIDAEVASAGLDPRRVALVGFSQGGYLAGFVGVRHAARVRGLVVAAGRVKDEFLADAAPAAAAAGLRVLDVHGERDEAVRPEPCRASLERLAAHGVATEFRTYDAGHAVLRDPRCRDDVRAFLADRLR